MLDTLHVIGLTRNTKIKKTLIQNLYPISENYNPGENIWHKVKKYSKIGQGFRNVISNSACFFDSYCQRLISWKGTGHWAASPLTFDFFLIFPNFP